MKKIIKLFTVTIFSFMLFIANVFAAGFSISVTSSTVTVGNSISLNITASEAAGQFTVTTSDSSVLSIASGSVWVDSKTESISLKANKAGTAKITVTATDVSDYNENAIKGSKTVTVTVRAKSTGGNTTTTPVKPKSSNNYLSSLTVEGYKLNESFDKEVLEYTLTLPAETNKVKINAQLADSDARVTGTGEVALVTGTNTLNVVVTAANGSKRTYVIKATVEELKPIEVQVDNESYTVVRKKDELPEISEYYEEKEVEIGEEKVDGYYNEKLDYTLVGLKDDEGSVDYYIYKDNKYTLYKEYTFGNVTLQLLDDEMPKGYKKTNFIYGEESIPSYQEVKLDILKNTYALDNEEITGNQFYLFYAKNVETGKTSLYQYDAKEKTVQRYNLEVLDLYKNNMNTYYKYLLIALGIIFALLILIIALAASKRKLGRELKEVKEAKATKPRSRKKKVVEEENEEEDLL